MSSAIPTLTYLQLSYLLTQLIYARTKSPQKGLLLFRKAWNMPVLFSICFYQIHINMTNDCASIPKTLMMGIKLMTERFKKNTHIISEGQCKDKYHNHDCKTPFIDIYIDLLSINFSLLSVLQHYAYHQISNFEIYISVVSDNILRIYIQEPS